MGPTRAAAVGAVLAAVSSFLTSASSFIITSIIFDISNSLPVMTVMSCGAGEAERRRGDGVLIDARIGSIAGSAELGHSGTGAVSAAASNSARTAASADGETAAAGDDFMA